jgi:hypothetical protein
MTAGSGPPKHALGAEPSPDGERDQIAVFRIDGIVEGWIPKLEGRVSDGLNQADRMQIRAAAADGSPGEWLELDLDQVVAVALTPRPPSPHRVARRQHAVEIEAGRYRVSGTAHLPPGADPERYVASAGRQWLPLTDCTVAVGDDEWAVDVAIVNLDHASRKRQTYQAPPFG